MKSSEMNGASFEALLNRCLHGMRTTLASSPLEPQQYVLDVSAIRIAQEVYL